MGERKVFCEECRNDVTFTINEKKMEGTIKGEKYSYVGKEAQCVDCGSEIAKHQSPRLAQKMWN
jgi:hypothetical protein